MGVLASLWLYTIHPDVKPVEPELVKESQPENMGTFHVDIGSDTAKCHSDGHSYPNPTNQTITFLQAAE